VALLTSAKTDILTMVLNSISANLVTRPSLPVLSSNPSSFLSSTPGVLFVVNPWRFTKFVVGSVKPPDLENN